MRFILKFVVAFFLTTGAVFGQTAAEILEQLDAQVGAEAQFRDLLSHPDPARSRGAMKLMAESGSPDLMRMALDAGLSSADPIAQRIALQGYFSSNPSLQVTVDGSKVEKITNLVRDMASLKGTVASDGTGFFTLKLGDYDEGQSCWLWVLTSTCGIRLSDAGAAIMFYDKWAPLKLGDDRRLRGEHSFYNTATPVPISLPVVP